MNYQVASVYRDPWVMSDFFATAVIEALHPDSYPKTLLGVTCQRYWVRFGPTSQLYDHWIATNTITTVADYERLHISPLASQPPGLLDSSGTRLQIPLEPLAATSVSLALAPWGINEATAIRSIAAFYNIPAAANAATRVYISLLRYTSSVPTGAPSQLLTTTGSTLSSTFTYLASSFFSGSLPGSNTTYSLAVQVTSPGPNPSGLAVVVAFPQITVWRNALNP